MALKLSALSRHATFDRKGGVEGARAPRALVEKVVFDGYQFGVLFTHHEGANTIIKAKPYNGGYTPSREHRYFRYWRFNRQALYDHGKDLVEALVSLGGGALVETEASFFEKLTEARGNIEPRAFTPELKATIYQLEGGGAVIVSTYHPGVGALAQQMGGRYLAPMKAWKIGHASPILVRDNLINELGLDADQVVLAQGLFSIVDDAFVPRGNQGATIKVMASDFPEALAAADDHDNEVYLAVTSPLKPTALSAQKISELISGYELYPYQVDGVSHLVRNTSALLADDMGLGKSRQAVCAAHILCGLVPEGQVLIVCPVNLMVNWSREIPLSVPGETSISIGKYDPAAKWIVINYDRLSEIVPVAHRFAVMIVDEAHLLKEPTALRTRLAFDIAAKVPYRALLTGTPILNRECEIHTLLRLSGHPIGNMDLKAFEEQFAGDAEFRVALNARLKEWMLRRTKDLVLKHLKGKQRQARYIAITEAERDRYNGINADPSILTLPKIGMLRKELEAYKVRPVIDSIRDMKSDDKVLLFCEFKETVELFKQALDEIGIGYAVLTGDMSSAKRRQRSVDDFQNDPLVRVFITTTAAGGVGHNLTAANYVFLVSLPWTPGMAAQAEDRAFRNGQLRLVIVLIPLVENSIDMDLVEMHRNKQSIAAEILDPEEAERLAVAEFAIGFERKAA
ncbi:RNA polymerase-associated protein RapA [Paraburkholderia domus]|uniref:DEAD/DEAH box helicase n=1 Tax=Paraburkholderia domus TaxID=2793075 RepID=UPI001912F362|nr:DEAD/DEAH box helicase [Paraburkholderia domus]MBK5052906.1 DEAD/DEAH box helicase [Burkholderia sp. R-70006]CAE6822588.1 RNA polymerase-associated protein RapA [Paraburkholderia domus]